MQLAAGPAGGGYYQVAEQYRAILARDGIDLELVETSGSVENAELISKREVDAAILQGGMRVADPEIEAIGALFFEPMIFLVRKDSNVPGNPALWKDLTINTAAPGSGTRVAFDDFEQAVGLAAGANRKLGLKYGDAVAALVAGALDVAVFVAPIDAPYLAAAYGEDALRLLPLHHTEAISRRLDMQRP